MKSWIQKLGTLSSVRPTETLSMSTAPRKVPTTETAPPLRRVPPTIGAANEGRSQSSPTLGKAEPRREMSMIPAIAARNPERA